MICDLPLQQTYVISSRLVLGRSLDGVGQEAEDGADPQQNGETTKQLTTELDPLWGGRGRSQGVQAIPSQVFCRPGIGQTLGVAKRKVEEDGLLKWAG